MSKKQSKELSNHTQLRRNKSRLHKDDINISDKRVTTTSCVLNVNKDINLRFGMHVNDSDTRSGNDNHDESKIDEDNIIEGCLKVRNLVTIKIQQLTKIKVEVSRLSV